MLWLREFATGMWNVWNATKPDRMAASLAFFSMFAFVPLTYIALLVAGFFFNDALVVEQLVEQVARVMGPETASFVRDLVAGQAQRQASDSILISLFNLAILLFVASGLFGSLEDMLNTIWGNPFPAEHGVLFLIRTQFLAFVLVIGVGLLVMLLTAADFILTVLGTLLQLTGPLILTNSLVLFALTLVGFAVVYRVLARKKPSWRYIWLGALVASLLFSLGRSFFGWYLQLSNFSSAYAAAGVLAVILLAVYYAAIIFLVGAMFVRVVPETFAKLQATMNDRTTG